MDLLSILYMGGMVLAASGTTFYLTNRNKKDGGFTIKSDGVVSVEETPTSPKPKAPPKQGINTTPMIIDMNGIDGIRLEGSGNVSLIDGEMIVNEDASIEVKKHTIIIHNDSETTVVNGVFNSFSQTIKSNRIKKVFLHNFNPNNLSRISLKGSGDMEIGKMKIARELDVILKGSGDIKLTSIHTGNLSLSLQGSGDILIDGNCQATQTLAKLQGSGDITIKSNNVGVVSQIINGSGDIKIPTIVTESRSYFHGPQTDSSYFR